MSDWNFLLFLIKSKFLFKKLYIILFCNENDFIDEKKQIKIIEKNLLRIFNCNIYDYYEIINESQIKQFNNQIIMNSKFSLFKNQKIDYYLYDDENDINILKDFCYFCKQSLFLNSDLRLDDTQEDEYINIFLSEKSYGNKYESIDNNHYNNSKLLNMSKNNLYLDYGFFPISFFFNFSCFSKELIQKNLYMNNSFFSLFRNFCRKCDICKKLNDIISQDFDKEYTIMIKIFTKIVNHENLSDNNLKKKYSKNINYLTKSGLSEKEFKKEYNNLYNFDFLESSDFFVNNNKITNNTFINELSNEQTKKKRKYEKSLKNQLINSSIETTGTDSELLSSSSENFKNKKHISKKRKKINENLTNSEEEEEDEEDNIKLNDSENNKSEEENENNQKIHNSDDEYQSIDELDKNSIGSIEFNSEDEEDNKNNSSQDDYKSD